MDRLLSNLSSNLRLGLRTLVRRPGFTATALVTLALGIGANSAIFSVVNGILLSPFGFDRSEQLVLVWQTMPDRGVMAEPTSAATFDDWRKRSRSFTDLAAFDVRLRSLRTSGDPEPVETARVSPELFQILRVKAALGSVLTPGTTSVEAQQQAVISHGLWQRTFGGEPGVVGRTMLVEDQSYTVVGVMGESFEFLSKSDLWVPLVFTADDLQDRGNVYLRVVGRLKDGVSQTQAQEDLDAVSRALAQEFPMFQGGIGARIVPLAEQVTGNVRQPLLLLMAVVAFVLLVACANLANLQLARTVERSREFAVRRALGASRGAVIRQALTESVLLAFFGGMLGIALAAVGVRLLVKFQPGNLPRMNEVRVDGEVVLFTLVLAIVAGLLFGLLPALQSSRGELALRLKQGAGTGRSAGGLGRLRGLVVVAEIAIAMMLLIGGGLAVRSFQRLLEVDPGFAPRRVLAAIFSLTQDRYPEPPQRIRFVEQLLEQVQRAPSVARAGVVTTLPLSRVQIEEGFAVEGRPPSPNDPQGAGLDAASPDYFRTLGIPVVAGRSFLDTDREDAPPVVVINQRLAKRLWPDESPLGKRIFIPGVGPGMREIVGVVGDIRRFGLDAEPRLEVYVPFRQYFIEPLFALLVEARDDDPSKLAGLVRDTVRALDREQPIIRIVPMQEMLDSSIGQRRFNAWMIGVAALVALALALSGIYGVMSYTVSQRTQELGLRMALGAVRRDVLWMILRQGLTLTLAGIILGLVAALALGQLMSSVLFGVGGADPLTFVVVPLLFLVAAALASLGPAWRATRVDPMVALRYE